APGEVFGLLGPNGSGKSTALRVLLGFLRPTAGGAWIAGHDCWRDGVAARRHVAYLPGELRLYENMNGRQVIAFLAGLRGRPVNVQSISGLNQEERLVPARFRRPPAAWPELPGLEVPDKVGPEATFTHRGPLGPLLDWLGQQDVADLRIEPLGQAGAYSRYQGTDACAAR